MNNYIVIIISKKEKNTFLVIQSSSFSSVSTVGEQKERCQPVSCCWTADSKVYCGCKGGQVICVDSENSQVTFVLNPKIQESGHERTETLSLIRNATMESITEDEKQEGTRYIFFHFGNSSTPGLLYHTRCNNNNNYNNYCEQ